MPKEAAKLATGRQQSGGGQVIALAANHQSVSHTKKMSWGTVMMGVLIGGLVGGGITGVPLLLSSSSACSVVGAETLTQDNTIAVPLAELQAHLKVDTTARLVKLLDRLAQLSNIVASGASAKVAHQTQNTVHRMRLDIRAEANKLWKTAASNQDLSDGVNARLEQLFSAVDEWVNCLVNNVDVAIDQGQFRS